MDIFNAVSLVIDFVFYYVGFMYSKLWAVYLFVVFQDESIIDFISTSGSAADSSMRGTKQYHAQVRKREAEQQQFERKESVNKYFDQWGRITSKYVPRNAADCSTQCPD